MVANPNRPARTEEEKLEEQFKEKRLRQRIDRYLESQRLLKYQTKGMSQTQVAQKFAEAGVKLRASELVNYKPTQTTTQTTTQPTLAPQKQTSGFYYAKGKKSFSPTSLRINTSDVKTVLTTPQTTISDTAASEPFFRPKSSLVIPPSEIDRKLKEYAEVALEYKKYRIPFGTKSDLAEAALKEDTALVAFGNMGTREGEGSGLVKVELKF